MLLHALPPTRAEALGLASETLRAQHPHLVATSVTAFGAVGPYREFRAEELTATNAGGWCWLSPGALDEHERPPLKTFGHQADFQGGLAAAAATFAALYRAERDGAGEAIDVSVQDAIAAALEIGLIAFTYAGQLGTRHGARGAEPLGHLRSAPTGRSSSR